jgi:hypothetical protein
MNWLITIIISLGYLLIYFSIGSIVAAIVVKRARYNNCNREEMFGCILLVWLFWPLIIITLIPSIVFDYIYKKLTKRA